MKALLERTLTDRRGSPGAPQKNDVEVRRYPVDAFSPLEKKSESR
jgi:hypothetical protein